MSTESLNTIVTRQYVLLPTQPGCYHGKYNKSYTPFKWYEFENSLDADLFYNIHRIDKPSFYKLRDDILPLLRNEYKRTNSVLLSYESNLYPRMVILGILLV